MSGREWDVLLTDGNHIRLTADGWVRAKDGGYLFIASRRPVARFEVGAVRAVIAADAVAT